MAPIPHVYMYIYIYLYIYIYTFFVCSDFLYMGVYPPTPLVSTRNFLRHHLRPRTASQGSGGNSSLRDKILWAVFLVSTLRDVPGYVILFEMHIYTYMYIYLCIIYLNVYTPVQKIFIHTYTDTCIS